MIESERITADMMEIPSLPETWAAPPARTVAENDGDYRLRVRALVLGKITNTSDAIVVSGDFIRAVLGLATETARIANDLPEFSKRDIKSALARLADHYTQEIG